MPLNWNDSGRLREATRRATPKAAGLVTALVAALAFGGAGMAGAGIVVASSGPSAATYPVGRKLDDAGTVTLRAGDTLTVLDAKGTRVLRGAGTFPVAARTGTPAKSATFAVLTMQRSAQRVRTGAVRTGVSGDAPASPNLWFIDVARPGRRCLVQGQPVRLWRLDTAAPASYGLTPAAGGASLAIGFAAGAGVAAWDGAKLPVRDGGRYALSLGGKPVGTIETVLLPEQPRDAEAMAAELIAHGCSAQVDLLAATLGQP